MTSVPMESLSNRRILSKPLERRPSHRRMLGIVDLAGRPEDDPKKHRPTPRPAPYVCIRRVVQSNRTGARLSAFEQCPHRCQVGCRIAPGRCRPSRSPPPGGRRAPRRCGHGGRHATRSGDPQTGQPAHPARAVQPHPAIRGAPGTADNVCMRASVVSARDCSATPR